MSSKMSVFGPFAQNDARTSVTAWWIGCEWDFTFHLVFHISWEHNAWSSYRCSEWKSRDAPPDSIMANYLTTHQTIIVLFHFELINTNHVSKNIFEWVAQMIYSYTISVCVHMISVCFCGAGLGSQKQKVLYFAQILQRQTLVFFRIAWTDHQFTHRQGMKGK